MITAAKKYFMNYFLTALGSNVKRRYEDGLEQN